MRRLLAVFVRRLGWALLVVVGVGTLAFFIARALPGDPARMLVGPQARPADVARARQIYGLDRSTGEQYLRFWSRLAHPANDDKTHRTCAKLGPLHIDMGYSYRYRQPVVALIAKKAPKSLELALAALLVQLLVGLGLGIVAARKRGTIYDEASIGLVLLGVSAPAFVLGLALQWLLSHKLGLLPHDGYGATAGEQWLSLILPALTLGIYGAALYARLTRDELSKALDTNYARTARAKGASELRVTIYHALRNAALPIATLMVLDFGALVGGAIVTEKLFRWPGMGAMTVDAMVNRDGPVILGTVMFSAFFIVVATVLVDMLQALLDPRIARR